VIQVKLNQNFPQNIYIYNGRNLKPYENHPAWIKIVQANGLKLSSTIVIEKQNNVTRLPKGEIKLAQSLQSV
jgi:DNA modification methylase